MRDAQEALKPGRWGAAPLIAVAALALAACAGNRNPLKVEVERCPAAAVLGGTGTLTEFAGDGQATEDVVLEGSITNLNLECDQGEDVVSEVTLDIVGTRGPAMEGGTEFIVPYFVAVLRDNATVVTKEVYETRLVFGPDADRAESREVLRQRLPTIEQARRYDYEILVGFQLGKKELSYNLLR